MQNMNNLVPKKVFFTKGVGKHKDYLQSFEVALRDAGIEHCNIVNVSSIFPPHCEMVSKEEGLKQGREEGKEEGLKQGIEKGKEETRIDIALSMREKGISIDTIAKISGLSEQEINNL